MEDIAKEAELSPGTLYLYFKNIRMNCTPPFLFASSST
jgi:hypothetical protein